MKKKSLVLLALIMTLLISACGNKEEDSNADNTE